MQTPFERAKAFHVAGDLQAAADAYREACAADAADFRARHNLGAVHEALGEVDAAAAAYREALAIEPGAAWSNYNLARLDHLNGRLDAAEAGYRAALALEPELSEAHFNLGRLLLERGEPGAAETCLRESLRRDPGAPASTSSLGDALFAQRRVREALDAYRDTVRAAPQDSAAHFDVAKTLDTLRRHEEAIDSYRRALVLEPASAATREALARALDASGKRGEAIASVREWLSLAPGHELAHHLLASLGAAPPPLRCSDAYVRETFDRFAADFDATLARLDYRAPRLVAEAMECELGPPAGALDVLDLGCGTGLCAPLVRPWARRLEGVDLSAEMLARARRRGGYDALHEAEIGAFLREYVASWNVIVCADTFCYFGDLGPVLRCAGRALRPGGLLVFTVERVGAPSPPPSGSRLEAHGRYAHEEAAVRRWMESAGFQTDANAAALRLEGGAPVEGLVWRGRWPAS